MKIDKQINFYCDESCHIENDKENRIMGIAGISCPARTYNKVKSEINKIKLKHNLTKEVELKWTKISKSNYNVYKELVEYFFNTDDLYFRIILINKDKIFINNSNEDDSFETFYYKSYFYLLRGMLYANKINAIYLDKKDTQSSPRLKILNACLNSLLTKFDLAMGKIKGPQIIQSHEVPMMQITDILLGAMTYFARGLNSSTEKNKIINLIKQKSGYSLTNSTPLAEDKFNIFYFKSSRGTYENL